MNVLTAEGQQDGIIVNVVSPVAKTRMWGVEGEPDEICAPRCCARRGISCLFTMRRGGRILRAANGQFHATKALEAEGVDYPRDLRAVGASTADEVAANWVLIAVPSIEPRS